MTCGNEPIIDELSDLTRIAEQAVGLGCDIIKNTSPADIRLKGDRDIVTVYVQDPRLTDGDTRARA